MWCLLFDLFIHWITEVDRDMGEPVQMPYLGEVECLREYRLPQVCPTFRYCEILSLTKSVLKNYTLN